MRLFTSVVACALLSAQLAVSQSASVSGVILRDSSHVPLSGVDVSVPAQNKRATTDTRGAYRIDGLTAGRYAIVARRVGLTPLQDTIALADGAVQWNATMSVPPQMLDSVSVKAEQRRTISPGLTGFEERRAAGFGRFISADELRKKDNSKLSDVLRVLPGGNLVRAPGGVVYFTSSRKPCDGPVFLASKKCAQQQTPDCFATIYVDGIMFYSSQGGGDPPDINNIAPVSDLAGVEYYASDAVLPPKFTSGNNGCGTVLFWTRER